MALRLSGSLPVCPPLGGGGVVVAALAGPTELDVQAAGSAGRVAADVTGATHAQRGQLSNGEKVAPLSLAARVGRKAGLSRPEQADPQAALAGKSWLDLSGWRPDGLAVLP